MTSQNPYALNNEIALITGGGTGLGLGIARAMLAAGARVLITGRRREPLDEAVALLAQPAEPRPAPRAERGEGSDHSGAESRAIAPELSGGKRIVAVAGDVTQAADRAAWLARARAEFGGHATIIVNNAGNHLKRPALELTDADFQSVMAIHVNAAFALAREAAGPMLAAGRGNILFLASMASYMGVPQVAAYTAAKCAVVGLTRALAAEWSPRGVRVNAIAPGWIESPMTTKALDNDPARKHKILSRTPMGRMGRADDVGRAAAYLCSPAAAFVTGQNLPVDGGASIGF